MNRSLTWLVAAFVVMLSAQTAQTAAPQSGVWRTKGFADFRAGTFGNAGQNLYVSHAGVLQRIHQYDFNHDGWFDLVICNSQNHWEQASAYVYDNPLGDHKQRRELPSDGAISGMASDLNGDGYDDLVLAMYDDGVRPDLNAFVYFGGSDGLSEHRQLYLPAPKCWAVATGDFNGDGRVDLAFMCEDGLRLFYQSDLGFEPKRFTTLKISGKEIQIAADNVDGDRFSDLIVRQLNGDAAIYWGDPKGIDVDRKTAVPAAPAAVKQAAPDGMLKYEESVEPVQPLVRVVRFDGRPHLFLAQPNGLKLMPVLPNRTFGKPIELECGQPMSVAVGDIKGDKQQGIVVACRQPNGQRERSWIFWGSKDGLSNGRRTPLDTFRACDVAVGDLDGDGCDDVVFCQSHTAEQFTTNSLVYRGSKQGPVEPPVELQSEDARRVFIAKTSDAKRPQVAFVNHYAGGLLGRPDVSVFLGGRTGFRPERKIDVAGAGATAAIGCDLNDDGQPDLVVANCSENSVSLDPGSYVFYYGPKGLQHDPSLRLPTTRAHGNVCADLNRDGYLDLIFCGFDNPDLLVFYGTSQGFDMKNPKRIRLDFDGTVRKEPRYIQLADLNEDGWLDLIVPLIMDDRSLILWGGPKGFQIDRRQVLSVERAVSARAADINGDGHLDLLMGGFAPLRGVPHDSFLYIYWNGPKGLRQDQRSMLPASAANYMAAADFDNDGTLDVFLASYDTGTGRDCDSFLYWNRKGRGFSAADCTRLFTHSASGCVAADFNEDGWIDLAIANHKVWGDHRGWSAVWWNGPEGFDPKHITKLPSNGPHGTTLSPGNQRDRGPEEYYESQPFELPEGTRVQSIHWTADIPAKTWVKAQLRGADSKESLAKSPWIGPEGSNNWFTGEKAAAAAAQQGRWIMYRLALGAKNGLSTPRVREVVVEYGP